MAETKFEREYTAFPSTGEVARICIIPSEDQGEFGVKVTVHDELFSIIPPNKIDEIKRHLSESINGAIDNAVEAVTRQIVDSI